MTKSTYGTGCFMLLNTGSDARASTHRLLTTPGYEIGDDRAYALEGSIFVAGAAIRWLRDKMCLADSAAETETLARAARDDHAVTVIPAFVGLGARHWRPHLRGIIDGLTLDTTAADLVRATLESIAFQTHDLTEAMFGDRGIAAGATKTAALRVDGGLAQNGWFVQFLADVLDAPVEVPPSHETTAFWCCCPRRHRLRPVHRCSRFWRAMAIGPTPDAYNACQPPYGLARQLAWGDRTRVGLTGAHNDWRLGSTQSAAS